MKLATLRFLIAAALIILLIIICSILGITDGIMLLALPFTLIGKGLRALSLSGSVGNITAIGLYVLLCLLPLLLKCKGKWSKKDILLPLCSALLFFVLYYMINPAHRPVLLQNSAGDLALAGTVCSVLLSWLILQFLDSFNAEDITSVYSALRVFLMLCMVDFTVAVIACVPGCISSVRAIQSANTMPGLNLAPTYSFTVLGYCVTAAEYILDIFLLHLARKLLNHLQADPYTDACCSAAYRLSDWCKKYLVMLIFASTALNVLQLLFASCLHNLSVSFRLPVLSIALTFALLALTHLLYRGKALKEDNDLFI